MTHIPASRTAPGLSYRTLAIDSFTPAVGLSNPHLQTLWPFLFGRRRGIDLARERLELPDGDFLDLDWGSGDSGPLTMIIHGLEGCSRSVYVRGLMSALKHNGIRSVAMHFRGCSGMPNRLPRSYCAGETGDIGYAIRHVRRRLGGNAMFLVGYSLGGNAMLNWLATEDGRDAVDGAVAVSVPFVLREAAERMAFGSSRLYQRYLLRKLKATYRSKFAARKDGPISIRGLATIKDFFRFDDAVTAPLHGYGGADDYYSQASCRQRLQAIEVRTLLLHAADDPFMTPRVIPRPDELSTAVTLELSEHGGHVGFVGGTALAPQYWLEERIPRFFAEIAAQRSFPRVVARQTG